MLITLMQASTFKRGVLKGLNVSAKKDLKCLTR